MLTKVDFWKATRICERVSSIRRLSGKWLHNKLVETIGDVLNPKGKKVRGSYITTSKKQAKKLLGVWKSRGQLRRAQCSVWRAHAAGFCSLVRKGYTVPIKQSSFFSSTISKKTTPLLWNFFSGNHNLPQPNVIRIRQKLLIFGKNMSRYHCLMNWAKRWFSIFFVKFQSTDKELDIVSVQQRHLLESRLWCCFCNLKSLRFCPNFKK